MSLYLMRKVLPILLGVALLNACSSASALPPAPNSPGDDKSTPFTKGPDRDLVARVCTPCHAPEQVIAKRHTQDEWDAIIGRMLDRGARASETEQDRILGYLVRFYGP